MSGTMQPPQGGGGGPAPGPQPAQPQQPPNPLEALLAPLTEAINGWTQAQQARAETEAMIAEAMQRGVQAMEMIAQAQVAPRRIIRDEAGNPIASEPML